MRERVKRVVRSGARDLCTLRPTGSRRPANGIWTTLPIAAATSDPPIEGATAQHPAGDGNGQRLCQVCLHGKHPRRHWRSSRHGLKPLRDNRIEESVTSEYYCRTTGFTGVATPDGLLYGGSQQLREASSFFWRLLAGTFGRRDPFINGKQFDFRHRRLPLRTNVFRGRPSAGKRRGSTGSGVIGWDSGGRRPACRCAAFSARRGR